MSWSSYSSCWSLLLHLPSLRVLLVERSAREPRQLERVGSGVRLSGVEHAQWGQHAGDVALCRLRDTVRFGSVTLLPGVGCYKTLCL